MSYKAIVSRVKVSKHPGADSLKLINVSGYQVISGADIKDGDLMIFFPTDGSLSHEFCYHNSEYRKDKGQNKDPTKFGLFESNRRIKSIKLRGEISEGYSCPLESVAWTGFDLSKLVDGFEFTELNGKEICEKYYPPATRDYIKGEKQSKDKSHRFEIDSFPLHYDTEQLRNYISKIPLGSVIYFTNKAHGTSGRTTKTLIDQPIKPWEVKVNSVVDWLSKYKVVRDILAPHKIHNYQPMLVSGTRNTTINPFNPYKDKYRKTAENLFACIVQGETIYYEICGFTDGGAPIQSHKVEDKELKKKYGPKMIYSYGAPVGEQRVFVYRITQTTVNGKNIEMSWQQVKARCSQLGVLHSLEVREPMILTSRDEFLAEVMRLNDGPDPTDPSHIMEGLVIRAEHCELSPSKFLFKAKGRSFNLLESGSKDDDSNIDIEEIS